MSVLYGRCVSLLQLPLLYLSITFGTWIALLGIYNDPKVTFQGVMGSLGLSLSVTTLSILPYILDHISAWMYYPTSWFASLSFPALHVGLWTLWTRWSPLGALISHAAGQPIELAQVQAVLGEEVLVFLLAMAGPVGAIWMERAFWAVMGSAEDRRSKIKGGRFWWSAPAGRRRRNSDVARRGEEDDEDELMGALHEEENEWSNWEGGHGGGNTYRSIRTEDDQPLIDRTLEADPLRDGFDPETPTSPTTTTSNNDNINIFSDVTNAVDNNDENETLLRRVWAPVEPNTSSSTSRAIGHVPPPVRPGLANAYWTPTKALAFFLLTSFFLGSTRLTLMTGNFFQRGLGRVPVLSIGCVSGYGLEASQGLFNASKRLYKVGADVIVWSEGALVVVEEVNGGAAGKLDDDDDGKMKRHEEPDDDDEKKKNPEEHADDEDDEKKNKKPEDHDDRDKKDDGDEKNPDGPKEDDDDKDDPQPTVNPKLTKLLAKAQKHVNKWSTPILLSILHTPASTAPTTPRALSILVTPQAGQTLLHEKRHLFPFKEPHLRQGAFNISVGSIVHKSSEVGEEVKLGVGNVFDSAFPGYTYKLGWGGVDLLVLVGHEWGPVSPLMLKLTPARAIENGINILHCTSSGINAAFNPFGQPLYTAPPPPPSSPIHSSLMKLPQLMFATFIGNLPGAITYSVLGSFIGNLSGTEDFKVSPRIKYLSILVSLNLIAVTVVYVTMFSKKALRQAIHEPVPTAEDEDDEETALGTPRGRTRLDGSEGEPGDSSSAVGFASSTQRRSLSGRRSPRLSIDDDGDEPGATGTLLDAHVSEGGYTAEEGLLMKRTFWGCAVSLVVGIPIVLILTA
ncbi:hypothetical protein HDV05_001619 [Chytridiales sp. JEL 0842]|nr:hypothetical protein HDV05_001619 [Chytridiales sp. JEL 0842]